MKTLVALLGTLASVTVVLAQTPSEKKTDSTTSTTTPPAKSSRTVINLDDPKAAPATKTGTATKGGAASSATKAPAAKAKADPKAGAKKDEPPPKIEGMEIARPGDKGVLGLQIVDATFKMNFYDAKKKPMTPDVSFAVLRWNPIYQKAEERVVLNPAEKALTAPRNIRPPYNFKLYINLFAPPAPGADPVVSESYIVDFKQ